MEATKMAKQEFIQVINEELTADVAASCLKTMTGDEQATFDRQVYYPYHRFNADCRVPTLFGKESLSVGCLVDGINALGATSDPFEVERIPVVADEVMQMKVVNDEAHRAAYRILMHQLSKRLRTMASFDICLTKQGIVYKAFWILRSRDVLFMVDSVTGGMHPLRAIAA
jgi:hypothetical protein